MQKQKEKVFSPKVMGHHQAGATMHADLVRKREEDGGPTRLGSYEAGALQGWGVLRGWGPTRLATLQDWAG